MFEILGALPVGFEPTTPPLTAEYSTIELQEKIKTPSWRGSLIWINKNSLATRRIIIVIIQF